MFWQTYGDVYDGTQVRQRRNFQWLENDEYIILKYIIPGHPQALAKELYPIGSVHVNY